MSDPKPSDRAAPLAFWRAARAFVTTLFDVFGGPADVAARHAFDKRAYALICGWLRAGEAILRRLLLIEAAALAPAGAFEIPDRREAARNSARAPAAPVLDQPGTWRVSFRCLAYESGAGGGGFRERKAAARFHAAFPVAARMEALLRVFNDPLPFAQRLLKRLLRRPRRACDLLREPKPGRHAPRACADIPDLASAAWKAWAQLDTC